MWCVPAACSIPAQRRAIKAHCIVQGTNAITLYDDDNTADCTGGTGTQCAGTKLELGAERLELASHDTASFVFLANVDSGSWLLLNSYTYESIATDDIVNHSILEFPTISTVRDYRRRFFWMLLDLYWNTLLSGAGGQRRAV